MAQKIIRSAPSVRAIRPCGSQVLIELLTAQEVLSTNLIIEGDSSAIKNGAPQGYILDMGPRVAKDHGFNAGDRVALTGNYTPLPETSLVCESSGQEKNPNRPWILIEPQQIKAVLIEA